eukprot:scaffold9685_cov51-Cyclotella_meneghiniana.AAC.1
MSLLTVDSVGRLMACWDGTTCKVEVQRGCKVEQRSLRIPPYKRKGILRRMEESKGIAGIPGNSEEIWILGSGRATSTRPETSTTPTYPDHNQRG